MGKQAKARRRREGWGCTNRRFQPITARDDNLDSEDEDNWEDDGKGKGTKRKPAGIQRTEKAAKMVKRRRKETHELQLFTGVKAKKVANTNQTLVPIDWTTEYKMEIKKDFWILHNGKVPTEVDKELKQLRKSIGVSVRGGNAPAPVVDSSDLKLPKPIREFLADARMATLTSVQRQAIPALLGGADTVAVAPTGSGKTLAYVLPAVPHILAQDPLKVGQGPIALVLLPTRELAIQVETVCVKLQKLTGIRCVALHGGVDKSEQLERMLSPTHIVAATPGRLIDLVKTAGLQLRRVTYLVLDEADRLLALGFQEQLDAIRGQIRPDRQMVLTSATCPEPVQRLIETWVANPVVLRVKVRKSNATAASAASGTTATEAKDSDDKPAPGGAAGELVAAANIEQVVHVCAEHKKFKKLMKLVDRVKKEDAASGKRDPTRILVFCNKISKVGEVSEFLKRQRIRAAPLHGQLPQSQRVTELAEFRAGRTQLLVATDVAGRGIDIANLNYVVNYDFPGNLEQYVHRIGRAGRSEGSEGHAYSFFTRNLAALAPGLVRFLARSTQTVDPFLKELAEEFTAGKLDPSKLNGLKHSDAAQEVNDD